MSVQFSFPGPAPVLAPALLSDIEINVDPTGYGDRVAPSARAEAPGWRPAGPEDRRGVFGDGFDRPSDTRVVTGDAMAAALTGPSPDVEFDTSEGDVSADLTLGGWDDAGESFDFTPPALPLPPLPGLPGLPAPIRGRVFRDLAYGAHEGDTLDLFLPRGVDDAPIVIFSHGGAWRTGDKSDTPDVQAFLDAGIGFASYNYSLTSDTVTWPTIRDGIGEVFDFIWREADTYGYDTDLVGTFGHSSGAHLATWAALRFADHPTIDIDATATWALPSDLFRMVPDSVFDDVKGWRTDVSELEELVDADYRFANKAAFDAASPAQYLDKMDGLDDLPAFLLMHGEMDSVISPFQTDRFYEALLENGGASRVEAEYLDIGHRLWEYSAGGYEAAVVDFFVSELFDAI